MRFILLILSVVTLVSCGRKTVEEIVQTLPNGEPELVVTYEMDGDNKVKVYEKSYWEGKKLRHEGAFKNNKRHGMWKSYYRNGEVWSEKEYKEGVEDGIIVSYMKNGKIRYKGQYKDGEKIGGWEFYDDNGNLLKTEKY